MSLTRNTRFALASVVTLAAITGCSHAPAPQPEPTDSTPLVIDEAMQKRDWPQSDVTWANGDTVAGATRFGYVPQTEGEGVSRAILGDEAGNALLDTGAFIVQSIVVPFTYFVDPPFVKKTYQGVIYEPTSFAMPVLPPDEQPVEEGSVPLASAPEDASPAAAPTPQTVTEPVPRPTGVEVAPEPSPPTGVDIAPEPVRSKSAPKDANK